mgnify:CR=1 FL=1
MVGTGAVGDRGLLPSDPVGSLFLFHFLILIVTAGVLCISGADDSDSDADDHPEPDQGEHLEEKEKREENPLDTTIHADGPVDVLERVKEMVPPVRVSICAVHPPGSARVAAIRDHPRDSLVDRPAQSKIDDVASNEPRDQEDAKSNIAAHFVSKILEHLCGLFDVWSELHDDEMWVCNRPYRQKEVHDIHKTQDHIGNVVEAIDIGGAKERAREDVVRQHLVVILPPLLDVDDQDLLHPE